MANMISSWVVSDERLSGVQERFAAEMPTAAFCSITSVDPFQVVASPFSAPVGGYGQGAPAPVSMNGPRPGLTDYCADLPSPQQDSLSTSPSVAPSVTSQTNQPFLPPDAIPTLEPQHHQTIMTWLTLLETQLADCVRYKTILCRNMITKGKCSYHKVCMYAHSERELRDAEVNILAIVRIVQLTEFLILRDGPTAISSLAPVRVNREKKHRQQSPN